MAKIMLVEDDNNLREIYEARLQAEGYTIVAAKDGEEALVIAKAENPDLVISDVMMPKISGFEMLDILRNTEGLKDVKVIMLTALGQNDDQQRADRLGADRYLVKSQVTLEDIVNVAHQLLEGDGAVPVIPANPGQPTEPSPIETVESAPVAAAPEPVAVAPEPVAAASNAVADDKLLSDAVDSLAANVDAPSEPVSTVAPPVAAPEPVATATDPVADAPAAQSSASEEEAAVEEQIENFVAGASSTAPAATDAAAPMPMEPIAVTEPAEPTEPVASTEPVAVGPPVVMTPDELPSAANPITVTPQVATALAKEEPAAALPAEEAPSTGSVNVAGKKIIQPLDSEPKTDLNTLVAAEEAKEAVATGTGVITPEGAAVAMGEPAVPPAPAADDPSNIAL
jgi:CheY-like chemotaxis protein